MSDHQSTVQAGSATKSPSSKRSIIYAAILAIGAVAWIGSGLIGETDPQTEITSNTQADATAALVKVRVAKLAAEDRPRRIVVMGRTNAIKDAEIKAETSGQVIARPGLKGQATTKGSVLLELAMDDRAAKLKEAQARAGAARITYQASKDLQRKQFESQIKLAESNAELASAEAELASIKLDLARTKIRAPIDGYIETLLPGPGDYVEAGEVVALVVDLDPMRVIAYVTERDIGDVHVDDLVAIKLPNGSQIGGTVNYVSRQANDVTRTFRIDIWIDNPNMEIPAGLTAEAELSGGSRKAHKIPSSALTLNDEGKLGVQTLNATDIVEFMPVELLEDTPDGTWITGLPDDVTVIIVGHEFVIDGQKVNPTTGVDAPDNNSGATS